MDEEKAKKNLQSLIETQKIIQHINSVGKSNKVTQLAQNLGIEMDDKMMKDASKIGSDELIANALADRLLRQAEKGKSKTFIA
jgi:D-alanyl-D-alanine carboxypeptidase